MAGGARWEGKNMKGDSTDSSMQTSVENEADVEVLSISKTPKNRRRTAIAMLVLALIIIAGAFAGWYWWNNYRHFTVEVNHSAIQTTGRQTLRDVLGEHGNFGKKPGKLLSLSGRTLESTGGSAISVRQNDAAISDAGLDTTHLRQGDTITVENGKDTTESHTVHEKDIPFDASITTGGAIQFVAQQGRVGRQEYWVGVTSGEKVDKKVIRPASELKIDSISPKVPADKKVIALTFDDGPSSFSAPILQILKDKGAKATFFDIGKQSAELPQMERQMIADGNQVASHSNTHPDLSTLGRDALRAELSAGFSAISSASDTQSRMLRAPYGAFSNQNWIDCSDMVSSNLLWTIDTLDWKRPGEQEIKQQVLDHAYSGAIVLMHDGGGDRTEDVKVLPSIIDALHQQGYQFVTINELMKMDGRFPDWVLNNQIAPESK